MVVNNPLIGSDSLKGKALEGGMGPLEWRKLEGYGMKIFLGDFCIAITCRIRYCFVSFGSSHSRFCLKLEKQVVFLGEVILMMVPMFFLECVDVCWKCSLSLWIVIENRIHVVVLGRERSWWPPLFMDVYILISTASTVVGNKWWRNDKKCI